MFTGKLEEIDAALKGAVQKARDSDNAKTEIELRFRPFSGETGKGVGNESALLRAETKMDQMVESLPALWSRLPNENDTVELFEGGFRKIQSDGKKVVYQHKFSEESWKIKLADVYPIVFTVSVEKETDDIGSNNPTANSRRTRRRRSYVLNRVLMPTKGPAEILKVDFTRVENRLRGEVTLSYEIELEILGDFSLDSVKNDVQETTDILMQYIYDTPIVYDVPTWTAVLSSMNLMFTNGVSSATNSVKDYINKPRSMGWKDLTISDRDSLIPSPGTPAQYAVTIKTDGRRVLVYFHSSGIYLCMPFTTSFARVSTMNIQRLNGTILDAELIEEGILVDQKIFQVYIFDCLFLAGEDKRENPLAKRLGSAKAATEEFKKARSKDLPESERILVLTVKNFYGFTDRVSFYEKNRLAYLSNLGPDQSKLFKEDGLVFTHTGVYYPKGGRTCACRSQKARCEQCINFNPSKNLKYKLPSAVTIDFLIERGVSGDLTLNTRDYRKEYASTRSAPFVGTRRFPADPKNFIGYIVRDEFLGDNEHLVEGQVVEFYWDTEEAIWKPLRIRRDRAEPNSTNVANENWEIINDPIHVDFLLGRAKGIHVLKLMRLYHNYVKSYILEYWSNAVATKLRAEGGAQRNPILFDIGSGKGGDVLKWKASELEVYALEPDRQELAKLQERTEKEGIAHRIHPVHMKVQETSKIVEKISRGIIKKADFVTSFHSMTLIYESRESVAAFIETVKQVISRNGVFICMALDGKAIDKLMGDNKQISITGITIQRPAPRQIIVQLAGTRDERLAGQVEYLVDFDDLILHMEAAGFQLIKDSHLDSQIILNDSELLWSQLTRVIEMRYYGFKRAPLPSKRLDELSEIMKNIHRYEDTKTIRDVKIDEFLEVPSKMCTAIDRSGGSRFWTVGVLAGGSCFFHSLLWCISKGYSSGSREFRFEMVVKLRVELARNFTRQVYATVANGHLQEFSKDLNGVYSYEAIRDGLSDYTHWFGLEFLSFIQDQLNVNVHILWIEKGKLRFYSFGADAEVLYKPSRLNVLLYWHGENHFQPIGRSMKGESNASFVFSSNDTILSWVFKQ